VVRIGATFRWCPACAGPFFSKIHQIRRIGLFSAFTLHTTEESTIARNFWNEYSNTLYKLN